MTGSKFRQAGLSIIELMIAVTLGLLLVAGATQIFLSNTQAFRLQDNISSTQEAGRLGMEIMLADLRRAGVDYSRDDSGLLYGVTAQNNMTKMAAVPGLLADSDEVTIRYRVPAEVTSMSDCEGNVVAAGGVIANRYFVKMDTNPAIPALFCSGSGGAGTALIRGVESFQVHYGVMDASASPNPDLKDIKANGFSSPTRYVVGRAASGTDLRITSIRVGLLVRSEMGIQGVQAPAADIPVLSVTITKAALANVKINGNFPIHRVFTGVAALRNEAYGKFL